MSAIEIKNIDDAAKNVATKYYEMRGYEVIDKNFKTKFSKINLVVKKYDVLRFVKVVIETDVDKGLPKESKPKANERCLWEQKAADYLSSHDYLDMSITFDEIGILVIKKDRALIRCHANWFQEGAN